MNYQPALRHLINIWVRQQDYSQIVCMLPAFVSYVAMLQLSEIVCQKNRFNVGTTNRARQQIDRRFMWQVIVPLGTATLLSFGWKTAMRPTPLFPTSARTAYGAGTGGFIKLDSGIDSAGYYWKYRSVYLPGAGWRRPFWPITTVAENDDVKRGLRTAVMAWPQNRVTALMAEIFIDEEQRQREPR